MNETNIGVTNSFLIKQETIKYVLYARKSTESDEKQALSIDSQVKEMLQIAERENLNIIDIRRESHSAKDSGKRPVYEELLEDIRRERYTGILTWAPDRLSRNAGDLGSLVDLMDQKKLLEIRTYGQHFHNSPNEKFLLMILCSQAKLENDNKSINVKRGLKTRVEMGLWPCPAPTGYLKEKRLDRKCQSYIDPERGPIIKQMFEKVGYEKWSGRKIYHWLKFDLNFKSNYSNKNLSLSNIYLILQNPFYYGYFEYPKKSGLWYKGTYEPLITKELFDLVQGEIKQNSFNERKENKEFAFTKILTCGYCGSAITADKKLKKLANGGTNKHVYYMCCKSKDRNCKNPFINENDLIEQFENLFDKIDINEILIKEKIQQEIQKIKDFNEFVLDNKEEIKVKDVDIRNYCKFILRKGNLQERRELLECVKGGLIMKDKEIINN